MESVGGSVRGWSSVFRCSVGVRRVSYFRFLDPSWWFHRSLSTSTTAVFVFCSTAAVIHGWVDRFEGVTVVLRSAVLLSVGG